MKQKFCFIRRVDKGWITTVKDLESWLWALALHQSESNAHSTYLPGVLSQMTDIILKLSLVSISLYLSYLSCLSSEKKIHRTDRIHSISYNKLYLSFLLYWAFVREVSIKLYLSYEFFSYDRYDRYNDMETRLKFVPNLNFLELF